MSSTDDFTIKFLNYYDQITYSINEISKLKENKKKIQEEISSKKIKLEKDRYDTKKFFSTEEVNCLIPCKTFNNKKDIADEYKRVCSFFYFISIEIKNCVTKEKIPLKKEVLNDCEDGEYFYFMYWEDYAIYFMNPGGKYFHLFFDDIGENDSQEECSNGDCPNFFKKNLVLYHLKEPDEFFSSDAICYSCIENQCFSIQDKETISKYNEMYRERYGEN